MTSKTGPITLFGINRVSKKNSLDRETAEELSEALDVFEQNDESSVGIIHGVGGNFCAGFDLEEISKYETDTDSLPHFGSLVKSLNLDLNLNIYKYLLFIDRLF